MSKADALVADLRRAVEALADACRRHAQAPADSLIRDGLIQRFEFSFELSWKAIQAAAALEGVAVRSPRAALAHALQSGWASDEHVWFRMLEARNLSAHTYSEPIAIELAREIPDFLPALGDLLARLEPVVRRLLR